jgi:serine protease Do
MMKRTAVPAFRAVLAVAMLTAICQASEPTGTSRETPLVRAVKRAKSSVVNIHSEKTAYSGDALYPSGKGRRVNGMGTGIVIDERGYVVTNFHVVNGVDTLRATLEDGGMFEAKVVTVDREQDLAIIKIEAGRPLPVMPLGTSSDLMLGETVIAVGNAYGYEHSVTSGIISALSRDVEVNETQSYSRLIQTDASINPGNSGGPLLNLDGEVVGINVAIRAGAQRIGFAIPIDDARAVLANLLGSQELSPAYHGLTGRDVKKGKDRRLVVDSIESGSPAQQAGLQRGDVVLRAGSVNVVDSADFERALLGHHPGEQVELVVEREKRVESVTIRLVPRATALAGSPATRLSDESEGRAVERAAGNTAAEKAWRILGLKLAVLPNPNQRLAGTKYRGGMLVEAVRANSPAQANGISAGDVLVGLHVWETINEDNVSYVIDHPERDSFAPVKFYVLRDQKTLFGQLRIARAQQ